MSGILVGQLLKALGVSAAFKPMQIRGQETVQQLSAACRTGACQGRDLRLLGDEPSAEIVS